MLRLSGSHQFQSAPSAQAGRNKSEQLLRAERKRFNPLPALRPGGTRANHPMQIAMVFQSAPSAQAGRNWLLCPRPKRTLCFNPLPALRPGGTTLAAEAATGCYPVSIRSQRSGREEPGLRECSLDCTHAFQSAPSAQAGRNPFVPATVVATR